MTVDKTVYKCSCGYVTHFEKALKAHCRFRKHKPLDEEKAEAPLMTLKEPAEVIYEEEIKQEEPAEKAVKKTRKPRKKAEKE